MPPLSIPRTRTWWLMLLPLVAAAMSFRYTCITPFAAFTALAALWLSARAAALAVTLVWLANQLVGFVFLAYPHDATTVTWAPVLLIGVWGSAAAATQVSRWAAAAARTLAARLLRAVLTLAAAYVTYQVVVYLAGLFLDNDPFSLTLQRDLIALNGATFVGLLAAGSIAEALWRRARRGTARAPQAGLALQTLTPVTPQGAQPPWNATVIAFPQSARQTERPAAAPRGV